MSNIKRELRKIRTENGEQEGKTGPVWGFVTSERGEDIRKWYRIVNMAEILYIHV
jgi:hypothetical protein